MKTMLKFSLFAAACFMTGALRAQQPYIKWETAPVLHEIKKEAAAESAVILADKRVHQYLKDEKGNLYMKITAYKLIKVQDDKGVEMYNKIYIPLSPNAAVVEIKARSIQAGGKVVELSQDKIFDAEEEGRRYKKFALEGVEKGGEIEYSYTVKKDLSFFGLEVFRSGSNPIVHAEFVFTSPDYLYFTVKGNNGFKTESDTTLGEERVVKLSADNILPLEDEKYGNADPYNKNVQYKLSYNLSKDKNVRMFTWGELAKNVFTNTTTITEKEDKAVSAYLEKLSIPANASEAEKIMLLEDYIKSGINSDKESIGEDADKLDKIVKTKVASNDGMNKLFIACLDKLKINWQIVFPSKRDELPLDESLENYRLLDEMLLYFPATGNFLDPLDINFRYPFIQPYWAATKGLFLKGTTIGSFRTATHYFSDISIQPVEKSAHNMETEVRLNPSMDSLKIHSRQVLLGYGASYYRPAYNFIPKDKINDLTKDIIKSISKDADITNMKVENTAMSDGFYNKPLVVEGDLTTADLTEVAGKKILVKIGEVIGPQEQMYQEKPRQLPITLQYPHVLDRKITFIIPDGYFVKNTNDLVFNITDKEASGKETMGFVSSYKTEGNKILIDIHEFYNETAYPVSMFEPFRKVINASADFNKVVLILEKK